MTIDNQTASPASAPLSKAVPRVDHVLDALRSAVLSGRFEPGDALRELHLAREYGVSQSVVREALVKLEHLGLVTRVPNTGTRVTSLTDREVHERLAVRLPLETLAFVQASASMGDEQFAALDALSATFAARVLAGDYFEAAQADFRLHRYVWGCSGNGTLVSTLSQLTLPLFAFVSIRRQRRAEPLQRSAHVHDDVIAALRTQDEPTIRTALGRHLHDLRPETL